MIVGVFLYEVFMIDSRRVVNLETLEHIRLMSNRLEDTNQKRKATPDVEKSPSGTATASEVDLRRRLSKAVEV